MSWNNSRIHQIEQQIKELEAERQELIRIENIPVIKKKVDEFLTGTYSGRALFSKHSLDEEGLWEILGEDTNCELGGYHHMPSLGIYEGTLQEVLEIAVEHKDFYAWGGGGDVRKVNINKTKNREQNTSLCWKDKKS